jgi:hypothetical protein
LDASHRDPERITDEEDRRKKKKGKQAENEAKEQRRSEG